MVFSTTDSNITYFENHTHLIDTLFIPVSRWGATLNSKLGAGYYSHQWGILPFSFGKVPDEVYLIYRFN